MQVHKIYDAVHGFIHFNAIEQKLIDSPSFQRLHCLHQLGIAFLVYPGAKHTRFEHSLGTMHVATQIFDSLMGNGEYGYERQIVRLAALCHDLGHLPFSHVAEKVLLGPGGHEGWTLKLLQSQELQEVWDLVLKEFPGKPVCEDVIKMAIGKQHLQHIAPEIAFSQREEMLGEIVTGDFFGADRIDYLLRDAQCTGVSYGLFDYKQLIEMLVILKTESGEKLGIEENGISSCEALLLARYFMHKRVYQHSSVKAYTFHLSRFMERFYKQGEYLTSLEGYLKLTDHEILSAIRAHPEDLDAAVLLKRQKRFFVLEVAKNLLEEMTRVQQKLNIPEESLSFAHKTIKSPEFSFPVRLSNGKIVSAEDYSQVKIPATTHHFIYIDAPYTAQVKEELNL